MGHFSVGNEERILHKGIYLTKLCWNGTVWLEMFAFHANVSEREDSPRIQSMRGWIQRHILITLIYYFYIYIYAYIIADVCTGLMDCDSTSEVLG